jgi:hypothetical protein
MAYFAFSQITKYFFDFERAMHVIFSDSDEPDKNY